MKILVFHNFYRRTGGEDHSVQMEIALLKERGHRVITFFEDSSILENMNFDKKMRRSFNLIYSTRIINKIQQLVNSEKPDIAHLHNVFPLITPSAYIGLHSAGVPIVQTLRNYRLICPNGLLFVDHQICTRCTNKNFFHAMIHRCLHKDLIQSILYASSVSTHWAIGTFPEKLGTVVVLSKFMANLFSTKFEKPNQVHVLPNFIKPSNQINRTNIGQKMLYIGRLSGEKGVLHLVEAFKEIPDIKLQIAGTGPLENEIKDYIKREEISNIEMLGYVQGSEKQKAFREAICIIVPSIWHEPFGRVVLEAYQSGVPVIASRIGGLPELVIEGETGFLYAPQSNRQLRERILQINSNKEMVERMGRQARSLVEREYGPDRHYQRLTSIYENALEQYPLGDINPTNRVT